MKTNSEKRKTLHSYHKRLQKEIKDYMKAKKSELRKRPVFLDKHSDRAVDAMREAFESFILETYR